MKQTRLFLPSQFSDGCILQRNVVNVIYGEDSGADQVRVTFGGKLYYGSTDHEHRFEIALPEMDAGGPYVILIEGSTTQIIQDVYFGDVFLLSGQSNMELPLSRVLDVSSREVYEAAEPYIRQFLLPGKFRFDGPDRYLTDGSWKSAIQENILEFSAVGYFFAKQLKDRYQVPIGLIMTAVGGSRVEAFMSEESLQEFGDYESIIHAFKEEAVFTQTLKEQNESAENWVKEVLKTGEVETQQDPQLQNSKKNTEESAEKNTEKYTEKDSEVNRTFTFYVPSMVKEVPQLGEFSGAIGLERKIMLESIKDGEKGFLYLGAIIDADEVWINGIKIGQTFYRYPPRKYEVPAGVLKEGENLLKVRVIVNHQNGGFVKGMPYYLEVGGKRYPLEGDFLCRIIKRASHPCPDVLWPPELPICFYNTRIVPLAKTRVRAVLWYQGESNTFSPNGYARKFEKLVLEWRKLFGQELPFLTVQLPGFQDPVSDVLDSGWAQIRQEQTKCIHIPKVFMVQTLDLGTFCDLHPQRKKEVGQRLALAARNFLYNEEIEYSGPIYHHCEVHEGRYELYFEHLEKDIGEQELQGFELVDADGTVEKAHAKRIGSKVIVWTEQGKKPVWIRYAWYDNPPYTEFRNDSNLPAGSFQCSCLIQPTHSLEDNDETN